MDKFNHFAYYPPPVEGYQNCWFPYYHPSSAYYNYYDHPYYDLTQRPYYSSIPGQPPRPIEPQVIKVEEDSSSRRNSQSVPKKVSQLKPVKNYKKKKSYQKPVELDKHMYDHPPKFVNHKVKYFDPYSSPVVTAADYNAVDGVLQQNERSNLLNKIDPDLVDDLQFPENDANPFIVFKFRRIKKKFKKYVKQEQQFFQMRARQASEFSNNFEAQSQSSAMSSGSDNGVQNQKSSCEEAVETVQKTKQASKVSNTQNRPLEKINNSEYASKIS